MTGWAECFRVTSTEVNRSIWNLSATGPWIWRAGSRWGISTAVPELGHSTRDGAAWHTPCRATANRLTWSVRTIERIRSLKSLLWLTTRRKTTSSALRSRSNRGRWISEHRQLGEDYKRGTRRARITNALQHPGRVTINVADGGVDLSKCHLHAAAPPHLSLDELNIWIVIGKGADARNCRAGVVHLGPVKKRDRRGLSMFGPERGKAEKPKNRRSRLS